MAMARQQAMESINPATGGLIERFPLLSESEVDLALTNAELAFHSFHFDIHQTIGSEQTLRRGNAGQVLRVKHIGIFFKCRVHF